MQDFRQNMSNDKGDLKRGDYILIIKRRTIPLRILIDEALLRRLPPNHPKRAVILQDLMIRRAGLKGEQDLDYYINLLHENDFHIFQNIRLPFGKTHFQIDFLLLSSSLILLIEAKNMPGILEFDTKLNQVLRTYNDKLESYEDPILQVKRQREQLKRWLKDRNYPSIPIEFIVAYSNSASILKNPGNDREVYERICKAGKLVFKIEEYRNKWKNEILSEKELKRLSKQLLKSHEPEGSHLHFFSIDPADILPGVQCKSCGHIPMVRYSARWHCDYCGSTSKDAHEQAIRDYFFLISPYISTKKFKEFLFLPTRKMAADLVLKMGLQSKGGKRNRVYTLT
jgi:hypothetical protein